MTEIEKPQRDTTSHKQSYQIGTRIILEYVQDDTNYIPIGMTGTIVHIDDNNNLYVRWDNGRCSNTHAGIDKLNTLTPDKQKYDPLDIYPNFEKFRFRVLTPDEQKFDQKLVSFITSKAPNIKTEYEFITFELPNNKFVLTIFASEIDDRMTYVIEPDENKNGQLLQCGFSSVCEFGNIDELINQCRFVIATAFPDSCKIL